MKSYKKSRRTVGCTGYGWSSLSASVPANVAGFSTCSSCCEKTEQVRISYTANIIDSLINVAREFLLKLGEFL